MQWNVNAREFVPGQKFLPKPYYNQENSGECSRNVASSGESSQLTSSALQYIPGTSTRDPGQSTSSTDTSSSDTCPNGSCSNDTCPNDTCPNDTCSNDTCPNETLSNAPGSSGELCPYYLESGECGEGERCLNVHGMQCKYCQRYCLPPGDEKMQKVHEDVCQDIQTYSQAAEASKDLSCAVCYEVVLEKEEKRQRKFGLLSECWHTFCLDCIRRWRNTNKDHTKRNCPVCRKLSYFIIPSDVWVSDPAEKDKLVHMYKEHLATVDCRHFNKGQSYCPFGANCFYKHALPDGTIVSDNVVRRRVNCDGDMVSTENSLLSEFLEELLLTSAVNIQRVHDIRSLFQILNISDHQ